MPTITCIEDLKRLHRTRTPRMFWDYCQSGSYTEQTFRDNEADFALIRLRQRVARNLSNRVLTSRMLGEAVTMPVALAPVGSAGMQHPDGEILAARAAARFGAPFTLSTMSICSIEDVAQAVGAPFWFQLYAMRDEGFVDALIERARAAGCSALVLTLDLQVLAQRHSDLRNGLTSPPRPTFANLLDIARRPRWALGMARTPRRRFGNIVGHVKGIDSLDALTAWTNEQFDPELDWAKVARIRDRWAGRFVVKGILDPEDARMAAELGVDAIVVSNHGGRQLDGAPSSIRALPQIVAAVGPRTEVWLDSGIRSGQDVLKALALGARGTLIGRAYLHGLGAMGEGGVTLALELIRRELDTTMALCGECDVSDLGPHNLILPGGFACS